MRTVLFLLLSLVLAPASAEWVKIAETDRLSLYLDADSLHKDGHRRKVWEIHTFKQRLRDGEWSRRELQEYDCRNERFRSVSFYTYAEPMAGGTALHAHRAPAPWAYVPYRTPHESVLRLVCGQ